MTLKQKKVTKAQAISVHKQICKEYGWALDDKHGPKLIMDFDWLGYGGQPHIVWEEGPFEWALKFRTAKVNVFLEPMTNWALGIYPPM